MPSAADIAKVLDRQVAELSVGLPGLQQQAFDKIRLLLKDLTLTADGLVKPTIANLKVINKVRSALEEVVTDKRYKKIVGRVQDSIDELALLNTSYFSALFTDFSPPAAEKQLKQLALDSTKENLIGAGVQENVVNAATEIVDKGIRSGSSFSSLQKSVEDFIVGTDKVPGKLASYSQQIMSDTLSGFTATYHKLVAADLGLQWYQYVGATMKTTRPWCRAMVEKHFVHESELAAVARGNIDGKKISLAGLFPNTNGSNVVDFRGGYNCRHLMVPVPEQAVPTSIKRKFTKDVPPDKAELEQVQQVKVSSANKIMTQAREAGPELETTTTKIAIKHGASTTGINYKSQESIIRKAENDYAGDITKVADPVRTTIISPSEKIEAVTKDLQSHPSFIDARIQTPESNPLGYSGNIIHTQAENGLTMEVQINTPEMIYAKESKAQNYLGEDLFNSIKKKTGLESGLGHAYYEEYRLLDPSKAADLKRMLEIEKLSKEYYSKFR